MIVKAHHDAFEAGGKVVGKVKAVTAVTAF
jgi:hypothetical protein